MWGANACAGVPLDGYTAFLDKASELLETVNALLSVSAFAKVIAELLRHSNTVVRAPSLGQHCGGRPRTHKCGVTAVRDAVSSRSDAKRWCC